MYKYIITFVGRTFMLTSDCVLTFQSGRENTVDVLARKNATVKLEEGGSIKTLRRYESTGDSAESDVFFSFGTTHLIEYHRES